MVITIEDLRKNEIGLCGSFLKMVDDVKAVSSDPSEQQLILTQMVLKELMMNKNKPEPDFSLGFPKKKRSGLREMPKQNQKQKIIIKFKRCVSAATGTASYSCSVVSNNPGAVVNPPHDDQEQDLKSTLKCKKRCYFEMEHAGNEGFDEINSKRLRMGKNSKSELLPSVPKMEPDRIQGSDHPNIRAIAIAGEKNQEKDQDQYDQLFLALVNLLSHLGKILVS